MLSNMASSLIQEKRISTTVAKAKALRKYVEPLITKAKSDTTHSRRVVFSYLQNKESVQTLFHEVADKVADRPGGYTRILKTGNRLGDNADMCIIELVDFNETMLSETKPEKAKTRRGRRKSSAPAVEAAPAKEKVVEEVAVEEPQAETEGVDAATEAEVAEKSAAEGAEIAEEEVAETEETAVDEVATGVEEVADEPTVEAEAIEAPPADETVEPEASTEDKSVEETPADEKPAEEEEPQADDDEEKEKDK